MEKLLNIVRRCTKDLFTFLRVHPLNANLKASKIDRFWSIASAEVVICPKETSDPFVLSEL